MYIESSNGYRVRIINGVPYARDGHRPLTKAETEKYGVPYRGGKGFSDAEIAKYTKQGIIKGEKTFEEQEPWKEDWDRWRKEGENFTQTQYDEQLKDLFDDKTISEKTDKDELDTLKLREIDARLKFRTRLIDDFNRNMSETKGDWEESLGRMDVDKDLWESEEARGYKEIKREVKETFNRRGLYFSGFHEKEKAEQEREHGERTETYQRAYERNKEDLTTSYQRAKEGFETGKERSLGDYETAYAQQLEDWEKKYGLQKGGTGTYQYGYRKDGDIKYGVGMTDASAGSLESQGYKFFGTSAYDYEQTYNRAKTQAERDRLAQIEDYATQQRSEERTSYEDRRRRYYESHGYKPGTY